MSDQEPAIYGVTAEEEAEVGRRRWVKPEVREMAAGSAELGFGFIFDVEGGS